MDHDADSGIFRRNSYVPERDTSPHFVGNSRICRRIIMSFLRDGMSHRQKHSISVLLQIAVRNQEFLNGISTIAG